MTNVSTFPVKPAAPKNEPKRYLGLKESNKILRKHLAREFPGVKFSIRGQSYSGGSSTDIRWADGPTEKQVDGIVGAYSNRGFDGMIDMGYCKASWLMPDGTITYGIDPGTRGQRGSVEGYVIPKPHPDAELVSTGIGYVHTRRDMSSEFIAAVRAAFERADIATQSELINRAPFPYEDDTAKRIAHMIPAPRRK